MEHCTCETAAERSGSTERDAHAPLWVAQEGYFLGVNLFRLMALPDGFSAACSLLKVTWGFLGGGEGGLKQFA